MVVPGSQCPSIRPRGQIGREIGAYLAAQVAVELPVVAVEDPGD
jgi:hypothetical protein